MGDTTIAGLAAGDCGRSDEKPLQSGGWNTMADGMDGYGPAAFLPTGMTVVGLGDGSESDAAPRGQEPNIFGSDSTTNQLGSDAPWKTYASSTLDLLRSWSINTYKCTRQLVWEHLGRGSRTVEPELLGRIQLLQESQRRYRGLLRTARALHTHFQQTLHAQCALADAFADLARKGDELQEEFSFNAETQRLLQRNGDVLLGAMDVFLTSLNTLVNKTMVDTLMTVGQYEASRLEYDAFRADLESLSTPGAGTVNSQQEVQKAQQLQQARVRVETHWRKYEQLRSDVTVKLNFLEENKVKVMQKQLLFFRKATAAYFTGNQQELERAAREAGARLETPASFKSHSQDR
uniref:arfaptin-2-like isoform X2 n=1 Tax=Myxine glutinosa TaxID=7769 RepID=UPI0035900C4D